LDSEYIFVLVKFVVTRPQLLTTGRRARQMGFFICGSVCLSVGLSAKMVWCCSS